MSTVSVLLDNSEPLLLAAPAVVAAVTSQVASYLEKKGSENAAASPGKVNKVSYSPKDAAETFRDFFRKD